MRRLLVRDRKVPKVLHDLREHLLIALALEQCTIPPYLCALYSIVPGTNLEAFDLIRSVVMEEMLHMALAANLLNAVGHTEPLPVRVWAEPYPKPLPHSAGRFRVSLDRLSDESLHTFLKIEKPARRGARPQLHKYRTIGQFYQAIEGLLKRACKDPKVEVFTGDPRRQVTPETWYYGGAGDLVVVKDLKSACEALALITEQGEGVEDTILSADSMRFDDVSDLAHYFRFKELVTARRYRPLDDPDEDPTGPELPIDWSAVAPMCLNPRSARYKRYAEAHAQMVRFNAVYTRLLLVLGEGFGGRPEALRGAVPIMYELRYQAEALMRIPSPLKSEQRRTLGPAFEWDEATAKQP
jgi:hypothetical protein